MNAPVEPLIVEQEDPPKLDLKRDNLHDAVDRAVELLRACDAGIYRRGDVLVAFHSDEELRQHGRPAHRLAQLEPVALTVIGNRHIKVFREDRSGELRPVNFPAALAAAIIGEDRGAFPQLRGIVETPIVLHDGRLLEQDGYDAASGLRLCLKPYTFELFNGYEPSRADAEESLEELRDLLSGFCFRDSVSLAVALALIMTSIFRAGMPSAPAFGVSASAPGSGKTYLNRLCALLATGRDLTPIAWPGDEVEVRKLLHSALLGGDQVIVIDNLNGVLESDALCVILTAPEFKQRLLGTNELASVPTTATIAVNGNNLIVSGDLVRRTLVCWLDPGIERPETRRFAFDPLELARSDRGRYVRAILTIALAYLACGEDAGDGLVPYGGFEAWTRLVREPLVWLGQADPCEAIERSAEIDPVRLQLRALLAATFGVLDRRPFTVPELVAASRGGASQSDHEQNAADADQRRALREAIEAVAERNGEINKRVLGRWLAAHEGRIEHGLRVLRAGAKGEAGVVWRVASTEDGAA